MTAGPDHVLLPKFGEGIVLQPLLQFLLIQTMERGLALFPVHDDDVLRLEAVNESHGLRGDNDLRLRRGATYQARRSR